MDETEIMLADAAQALLKDRHQKERLRRVYHGQSAYSRALWQCMAGQGWLAITLAEELGGVALKPRHAAVITRALGRHAVPEPFAGSGAMVARLANHLHAQNPQGWSGVIEALLGGERVTALAWQESMHTLDEAPRCRATREGDATLLRGGKAAVAAADMADQFIVSATDGAQASAWLVPAGAPGLAVETALGADGGTLSTLRLEDVKATEAQCLGRGEDVLRALRQARDEAIVLTAAQLVGAAEEALAITLDYLRTRKQFGKAIGSFQSLQHLAVDVRVQQSLAQAAVRAALQALDPDHPPQGTGMAQALVARAKARAAQAAQLAGRFGVQAHGAIGFAAEADIGLYLKSALRLSAHLGNAGHHRQSISRLAPSEVE